MKITTWNKSTELELEDSHGFDVGKLVAALLLASVSLHASASDADLGFGVKVKDAFRAASVGIDLHASEGREATGEQILEAIQAAGGKAVVVYGEDGLVDSIHATAQLDLFEYDAREMQSVIESLHATGPAPSLIVGDQAQTSVGASGSEQQVIGLQEWTIDWKRKTADATTTDNSTYESSLGSTASWTVKAKYMFIDADTSQQAQILATISTPQAPAKWNFFPTIATGRASFSGLAYVDGITIASGMGKCVGLDVSLKGTGPLNILTQIAPVVNSNTVTGLTAED